MKLFDKYNDYKEKKEARAFFRRHNSEIVRGKDYVIGFVVGIVSSIILSCLLQWIVSVIGFNLSYFTILVGILQAVAIKKVLHKSGRNLAIMSVVTFILGVVLAQTIYTLIFLPAISFDLIMLMFTSSFRYMLFGDLLNTIVYLFGAIATFLTLKD